MKKLKKIIGISLALTLAVGTLVGCSNNKEEESAKKSVNFIVPNGVPSTAVSKLISDNTQVNDKYEINYAIENTSETLATEIMKGNPDIAIVPSNLAAQAYNKEIGYELVGTTGWGALYLVSTEGDIKLEDLKGKEVYNIGKGLTPDIVFKAILNKKGIKEDEVNFTYVGAATELAPALISGKAKYAVVPEPALTTIMGKNQNVKIIGNLNDIWNEVFQTSKGFPQASIIAKSSLIENDKEFLNSFLEKVSEGITWVNENPKEASEAAVKNGSTVEAATLEKSIKNSNIAFSKSKDTKDDYLKYYNELNSFNNKTIGGKVPDDKFFYEG